MPSPASRAVAFSEDIATATAAAVAGVAVLLAGLRKLQLLSRADTRTDTAGQSTQNGYIGIVGQQRIELLRLAKDINDVSERLSAETKRRYAAEATETAYIKAANALAAATVVATTAATAAAEAATAAATAAAVIATTASTNEHMIETGRLLVRIAELEAELREVRLARGDAG